MAEQETDFIHWQKIDDKPILYEYRVPGRGKVAVPALMVDLSDESPGLWNLLGVYLMSAGFRHIYNCRLPDEEPGPALAKQVKRILGAARAKWLMLLAYGPAAAYALSYIEAQQNYRKARILVGLNGEYKNNALSYLDGSFLKSVLHVGDEDTSPPPPSNASPGSMELANQFVMVNVYGVAPTSYLNPDRTISPLPEAVNVKMNLHPNKLMESASLYEVLRPYLSGEIWTIQLHLTGFQMRLGAPDVPLGRFYFEVEGQRAPPEAVFVPPDQADYSFEYYTPLGTIAIPNRPGLQAADIKFRLRESGKAAPKRRTLTSNLHVPLIDNHTTNHTMQDSFGSEIRLSVYCKRAPQIIPSP